LGISKGIECAATDHRPLTIRVDDGWHAEHPILAVVDDRINGRIADDREVFAKMSIGLRAGSQSVE